MAKLSKRELASALEGLYGWSVQQGQLCKQYEYADFKLAMAFVNRIADAAEAADHHPDMDIRYNKVTVALSTHSEGGITRKDVDLAREIEAAAQ